MKGISMIKEILSFLIVAQAAVLVSTCSDALAVGGAGGPGGIDWWDRPERPGMNNGDAGGKLVVFDDGTAGVSYQAVMKGDGDFEHEISVQIETRLKKKGNFLWLPLELAVRIPLADYYKDGNMVDAELFRAGVVKMLFPARSLGLQIASFVAATYRMLPVRSVGVEPLALSVDHAVVINDKTTMIVKFNFAPYMGWANVFGEDTAKEFGYAIPLGVDDGYRLHGGVRGSIMLGIVLAKKVLVALGASADISGMKENGSAPKSMMLFNHAEGASVTYSPVKWFNLRIGYEFVQTMALSRQALFPGAEDNPMFERKHGKSSWGHVLKGGVEFVW
ncbi:MAG: hypothetical protein A2583_05770 [Bdellovibrionales bacterium RIFOXYD1_FULL_53_11]|nr:MAG: hypothetical protein A2583_05770 [Bdellovibrionales bacterium RIFOXYD1_FULL_53_11]